MLNVFQKRANSEATISRLKFLFVTEVAEGRLEGDVCEKLSFKSDSDQRLVLDLF